MRKLFKYLLVLSPTLLGFIYGQIKSLYSLTYSTCYLISLIILVYWCLVGFYFSKTSKHCFMLTLGSNIVGIVSFTIICLDFFAGLEFSPMLKEWAGYFTLPMNAFTQYIDLSFSIGNLSISGEISKYIIGFILMLLSFAFGCFIRKTFMATKKITKRAKRKK